MGSRSALLLLLIGLVVLAGVLALVTLSGPETDLAGADPDAATSNPIDAQPVVTGPNESRESVANSGAKRVAKADAPKGAKATLDVDVIGLPIHKTTWITIAGRRVATPDGTHHRRMEVDAGRAHYISINPAWDPKAPRFYFPKQSFRTPVLAPGEYRRFEIDFRTILSARGRVLGLHGAANVLLAAQLELPKKGPDGKPIREHFSIATNEHGEFAIYGLKKGTLYLFHHDCYPNRGVGPRMLDRSGADGWAVPTKQYLNVETEVPLLGVRFLGEGGPTETLPTVPGRARTQHVIKSTRAIDRPSLEASGQKELQFHVAKLGRFSRVWRELTISGHNELLVPMPTKAEMIGSLRIEAATERGKARMIELKGTRDRSGGWILEVRSQAGRMYTLPQVGSEPWRLTNIRTGYYGLVWRQRARITPRDNTQPPKESWQNQIQLPTVDVKPGEEKVVKVNPPELGRIAIRVTNWKEIPVALRPTHVLVPSGPTAPLSSSGTATIDVPVSKQHSQFLLRRDGIGGAVMTAKTRTPDGVELTYPLTVKIHRVRLRPRLGGTPRAWTTTMRSMHGRGIARVSVVTPDTLGWLNFYAQSGNPAIAWFVEHIHTGRDGPAVALRGWKMFSGNAKDIEYDPGGRALKVELAKGTAHATIEVKISGGRFARFRQIGARRDIRTKAEIWLPDGATHIQVTVENQKPKNIKVKGLSSPFIIGR
jgi:hypothetical protein